MPKNNGTIPPEAADNGITGLVSSGIRPFANAHEAHRLAGWSVLHFPPGQKFPPPKGATGHGGADLSADECAQHAARTPDSNIGWRLPPGVVGIDVDGYDGKTGGKTLAHAQELWGALPRTPRSTSRDDEVSGIRFYRIPEGAALVGEVTFPELGIGCIDVIQHHHRYAVVPPSLHPKTGQRYTWRDGAPWCFPLVSELLDLPDAWVQGLRLDKQDHDVEGAAPEQVADFLAAIPDGPMCTKVRRSLRRAVGKLSGESGARHDAALGGTLALLRAGHDGHPGAPGALAELEAAFVQAVGPQREGGEREASREFARMVEGPHGIGQILETPTPEGKRGCRCADGPGATDPETGQATDAHALDLERAVRRVRVETEARDIVRNETAQRNRPKAPPLRLLTDLLAEPDEEVQYRVHDLWPAGGNVVVAAQFKAGKTVLSHNLARALADGGLFLDRFPVQQVQGRVVLLDTELSEATARRWLRDQNTGDTDKVVHVALRGAAGALNLLDPQARGEWAAKLRELECEVLILDPAAPALSACGLSESKNEDVGRFLLWWDQLVAEAGVSESMIIHHMGHSQERARGASRWRDWPDAEWLLTRGESEQPDETADPESDSTDPRAPRFLQAYGRDVDVPEVNLDYDTDTRHLSVPTVPQSRKDQRRQAIVGLRADETERLQAHVVEFVKRNPGATTEDVRKARLGKHDRVREALVVLVREGLVRVEKQGLALRHWVVPGEANP